MSVAPPRASKEVNGVRVPIAWPDEKSLPAAAERFSVEVNGVRVAAPRPPPPAGVQAKRGRG